MKISKMNVDIKESNLLDNQANQNSLFLLLDNSKIACIKPAVCRLNEKKLLIEGMILIRLYVFFLNDLTQLSKFFNGE